MWTLEWLCCFFVLSIILYKRISCCWSWINKKGSEKIKLCNELHSKYLRTEFHFPGILSSMNLQLLRLCPETEDGQVGRSYLRQDREGWPLQSVCSSSAETTTAFNYWRYTTVYLLRGNKIICFLFFRTRRAKNLWPHDSGRRLRADLLPRVWRLTCPLINKCEWNIFSPNQSNFMLFDVGEIFVTVFFYFFSLCPYRRLCTNLDNARTHCSMRTSSEKIFWTAWRGVLSIDFGGSFNKSESLTVVIWSKRWNLVCGARTKRRKYCRLWRIKTVFCA